MRLIQFFIEYKLRYHCLQFLTNCEPHSTYYQDQLKMQQALVTRSQRKLQLYMQHYINQQHQPCLSTI